MIAWLGGLSPGLRMNTDISLTASQTEQEVAPERRKSLFLFLFCAVLLLLYAPVFQGRRRSGARQGFSDMNKSLG